MGDLNIWTARFDFLQIRVAAVVQCFADSYRHDYFSKCGHRKKSRPIIPLSHLSHNLGGNNIASHFAEEPMSQACQNISAANLRYYSVFRRAHNFLHRGTTKNSKNIQDPNIVGLASRVKFPNSSVRKLSMPLTNLMLATSVVTVVMTAICKSDFSST